MKIGLIGLGKMGKNLAINMMRNNIDVVGFDQNLESTDFEEVTPLIVDSINDLVDSLPSPKIVWVMVPSGEVTKSVIASVANLLSKGDIVIDGGNSFYKDSIVNSEFLHEKGIYFFDCGTSGGMEGALNGGNFMIGGDAEVFSVIEPVFKATAQEGGYLYTGDAGSGHYLKMIHNGIEYGMMQAIGEGFELLDKSRYDFDKEKVADLWNNGSVIRSWLMQLSAQAFKENPSLEGISGVMNSSGEGKWTVQEALELEVAIPVIASSLFVRYESQVADSFSGKVVSSLRNQFGGHAVVKKKI